MQAEIYRQHIRLGVNHEEWDNGQTVQVRSSSEAECETSRENTEFSA